MVPIAGRTIERDDSRDLELVLRCGLARVVDRGPARAGEQPQQRVLPALEESAVGRFSEQPREAINVVAADQVDRLDTIAPLFSTKLTPDARLADQMTALLRSSGVLLPMDALARDVLAQTVDLLTRDPRPSPWGSYLALAGSPVGLCAFKAAPDSTGTVEIAYMTFPAFEGRGYATAMASALTETAFAAGAPLVIAHTLPVGNASSRALRRNNFIFAGETLDPEDGQVWRWERRCGP